MCMFVGRFYQSGETTWPRHRPSLPWSAAYAAWAVHLARREREVRELVTQGSLPQAQLAAADPKTQALKELTRLHGVGAATAAAWCARSVFCVSRYMFRCFRW